MNGCLSQSVYSLFLAHIPIPRPTLILALHAYNHHHLFHAPHTHQSSVSIHSVARYLSLAFDLTENSLVIHIKLMVFIAPFFNEKRQFYKAVSFMTLRFRFNHSKLHQLSCPSRGADLRIFLFQANFDDVHIFPYSNL